MTILLNFEERKMGPIEYFCPEGTFNWTCTQMYWSW